MFLDYLFFENSRKKSVAQLVLLLSVISIAKMKNNVFRFKYNITNETNK